MKQPFVIATAAVVGLVAGALSPIVFAASLVFFINADWPPLSSMAPMLAMMSGLGSLSGGIGGWDGWRLGRVAVGPLSCVAAGMCGSIPPPNSCHHLGAVSPRFHSVVAVPSAHLLRLDSTRLVGLLGRTVCRRPRSHQVRRTTRWIRRRIESSGDAEPMVRR